MLKHTPLVLALLASGSFAVAHAAPSDLLPLAPHRLSVTAPAPTLTKATAELLYDQMDAMTEDGAWSQNYESMYDAYDNEAADDFVVSDPDGWRVEEVVLPGAVINFFGDPSLPQTVNVDILADLDGRPDDANIVCSYTDVPGQFDGSTDFALATITLPSTCVLATGTYWLNVQANLSFDEDGLFYWMDRGVQSGSPAQWRNPDDGWESGCTDWTPKTECDQGEGVDMLFQIRGSINTPTAPPAPLEPRAVPSLNASGMLIAGGALALLALLGLRRRPQH